MLSKTNPIIPSNAIHEDVAFDQDSLYSVLSDENGNFNYKKIANYISINRLEKNLETSTTKAVIEYLPVGGTKTEILEVGLGEIGSASKIEKLLNYGVDVNSTNKYYVLKHLQNCMHSTQISFNHNEIGFASKSEKIYFKHNKLIGTSMRSKYAGDFNLKPIGSLEVWLDMVNKEVLGNTQLEVILLLAFSAPLIAYIGDDVNIGSQVIHLVGDSSVGKTTSLMLAMSLFSAPCIGNGGLILQWNSTNNAIIKKITGNYGIPVGLDESSMSRNKDFTSLLYTLAGGVESDRLTKEIKELSGGTWKTIIFSTGEFGLVSKSANNTGLRARVTEYKDVIWTKDAENSNTIKSICLKNYGHVGPLFVEKLLKYKKESIIKQYNKLYQRYCDDLDESQIKNRLAQKLALFMLSGYLIKKLLKLELNLNEIYQFMLSNENDRIGDFNLAQKAYEYISQVVSVNQDRFTKIYVGSRKMPKHVGECWGGIFMEDDSSDCAISQLAINQHKFNDLLTEHGNFQSTETVLAAFIQKKWIIKGKDRNVQRLTIGGAGRANYYVIDVKKVESDLYGTKSSNAKKKNNNKH